MKLALRLFGVTLVELDFDTEAVGFGPERAVLEASGGGQFEFGFRVDSELPYEEAD